EQSQRDGQVGSEAKLDHHGHGDGREDQLAHVADGVPHAGDEDERAFVQGCVSRWGHGDYSIALMAVSAARRTSGLGSFRDSRSAARAGRARAANWPSTTAAPRRASASLSFSTSTRSGTTFSLRAGSTAARADAALTRTVASL